GDSTAPRISTLALHLADLRGRRLRGVCAAGRAACAVETHSMSGNTFGKLFTVTTFGESHGAALGCIVDGCPPGLALTAEDIQPFLDKRKPGQSKYTTQRREEDKVEILSGLFEGLTTGTPIALLIKNI